jgi:hypothetical protein
MCEETERFSNFVMQEDRSVLDFLDADYSLVNAQLAKHYSIDNVRGSEWRRVSLVGTPRRGLLGQASILALTSAASAQTSPVQRGKWILGTLLGTPPPPPPAGLLDSFDTTRKSFERGSTREHLAQHREQRSCFACHAKIDGLGLTLESFDETGAWRPERDAGPIAPITLPSGEKLGGLDDLNSYLFGQRRQFVRALGGRLLAQALGRKLQEHDQPALVQIAESIMRNPHFSNVIVEVVRSEPFQARFGQP